MRRLNLVYNLLITSESTFPLAHDHTFIVLLQWELLTTILVSAPLITFLNISLLCPLTFPPFPFLPTTLAVPVSEGKHGIMGKLWDGGELLSNRSSYSKSPTTSTVVSKDWIVETVAIALLKVRALPRHQHWHYLWRKHVGVQMFSRPEWGRHKITSWAEKKGLNTRKRITQNVIVLCYLHVCLLCCFWWSDPGSWRV